jgi:hypothetical protein
MARRSVDARCIGIGTEEDTGRGSLLLVGSRSASTTRRECGLDVKDKGIDIARNGHFGNGT